MWKIAEQTDDDALVHFCRELNREDPGTMPVPDTNMIQTLILLRRQPERGRALVLVNGDRAVGYALLISFWSNELGGAVCNIDELFILPEWRGKGFATHLLTEILQNRQIWPEVPVALELEVSPANHRAQSLYRKLGFSVTRNSLMRREV